MRNTKPKGIREMFNEMSREVIAKINANTNGEVLAFRRVTALADDPRFIVAYSTAPRRWVTAMVDGVTARYIVGTRVVESDPLVGHYIGAALERRQADAPAFGKCALGHNDPIYVDDDHADCAVCGGRFFVAA